MKAILLTFAVFLLFITGCSCFRKFTEDAENVAKKAESLNKNMKELFKTATSEAVDAANLVIDEAFKLGLEPQTVRAVATLSAKLITEEVLYAVIVENARKIDKIFGTDRSVAAASMVYNTYGKPLTSDVVTALIENRLNLAADNSSYSPVSIDSIVSFYSDKITVDDALDFILGIATSGNLPAYYDSLDLLSVSRDTYAASKNWKDKGIIYQFQIKNGKIEMKRSDAPWKEIVLPAGIIPKSISADNNRLYVLSSDNQLWFYCIKDDQAQWSIDLMNTAVDIMDELPGVTDEFCSVITPHVVSITDTVACMLGENPLLKNWGVQCEKGSDNYWQKRCDLWTEIVLRVDKQLLKTSEDKSFTAEDYVAWSRKAHVEGAWTNLLTWSNGDDVFRRGLNIAPDEIDDIAVGNWNGTVVTVYIIAKGQVWYMDEEIIHHEWKPILQWNNDWTVISKDYRDIGQSPFPVDKQCHLDASNSVVAVTKPATDNKTEIYWIRWDYHQKDDFMYWPLDWCEHDWHKILYSDTVSAFSINTLGTMDPREDNTVWSVPAPAFTFSNYLPVEGYKGIFGHVEREDVSTYPVYINVKDRSTELKRYYLEEARYFGERPVVWEELKK